MLLQQNRDTENITSANTRYNHFEEDCEVAVIKEIPKTEEDCKVAVIKEIPKTEADCEVAVIKEIPKTEAGLTNYLGYKEFWISKDLTEL